MRQRDSVQRIDLSRPTNPPGDSKISAADQLSEPIGVHLVRGERDVLFGTGYDATATELVRALPSAPDVVVVEHGDPDHYGAVPSLRDEYDDLTVLAPHGDRESMRDAGVGVDAYLQHGESVAGFEAIHVSGHTPGNMSFAHADRGLLVVGDSFVTADSEIAADGDWSGPFAPLERAYCSDFDALVRNLPVLADYSFDTALLTHGADVVGDADRGVETLLADVSDRQ